MASAALRVMVVQRLRISSVLGLVGTLGTWAELSELLLELIELKVLELALESRRGPVSVWGSFSSLMLDSLPEEMLVKLDS